MEKFLIAFLVGLFIGGYATYVFKDRQITKIELAQQTALAAKEKEYRKKENQWRNSYDALVEAGYKDAKTIKGLNDLLTTTLNSLRSTKLTVSNVSGDTEASCRRRSETYWNLLGESQELLDEGGAVATEVSGEAEKLGLSVTTLKNYNGIINE